jgi:hypothetical protein
MFIGPQIACGVKLKRFRPFVNLLQLFKHFLSKFYYTEYHGSQAAMDERSLVYPDLGFSMSLFSIIECAARIAGK